MRLACLERVATEGLAAKLPSVQPSLAFPSIYGQWHFGAWGNAGMRSSHGLLAVGTALALFACGAQAKSAAQPLAPGPHQFSSAGIRLWYRVAGPSFGTPVVFLHGGPAEGSQGFARTIGPLLERRLRMIYFDQRGAGHSARPKQEAAYSMRLILDDIEHLRKHLGVTRMVIVGHSYGSMLALEYAASHPEHVARMVLVSAVPDEIAALNRECGRLRVENSSAYALAKKAADQPGDPDCIPFEGFKGPDRRAYFEMAAGDRPGTLEKLEQADKAEGVTLGGPAHAALAEPSIHYRFDRPRQLTMPILAISGAKDRIADPEPVADLMARIGKGRMVELRDAGHFAYVDDPNRFAREMFAFLATEAGPAMPKRH